MAKTFRGGVHPPDSKITRDAPIAAFDPPERVTVLLAQHIGAPCAPLVAKGDRVCTGQRIGEPQGFVSAPVHAPVTGVVAEIGVAPHPVTAARTPAILIDRDGDDEWAEGANVEQSVDGLDADAIKKRILDAGLVGLGGATFPTHVKLSPPPGAAIDTVILNGAECEPYLTCDHRLMVEETDKVLQGFRLMMRSLNCANGIVAVESNKPEAFEAMKRAVGGDKSIRVDMLKVKYPQGAEHQLIKAILGREVPWRGGLPMAVGCVVQNVATAYAVYDAVCLNKTAYRARYHGDRRRRGPARQFPRAHRYAHPHAPRVRPTETRGAPARPGRPHDGPGPEESRRRGGQGHLRRAGAD